MAVKGISGMQGASDKDMKKKIIQTNYAWERGCVRIILPVEGCVK